VVVATAGGSLATNTPDSGVAPGRSTLHSDRGVWVHCCQTVFSQLPGGLRERDRWQPVVGLESAVGICDKCQDEEDEMKRGRAAR
jgi:hypothetical protein